MSHLNTKADTAPAPQNIEAERSILGTCLVFPETVAEVTCELRAEDFYLPTHGKIFAAIVDLAKKGLPPDSGSFAEYFPESQSGISTATLLDLSGEYGVAQYIGHHIEFVKQASLRRQAVRIARSLINDLQTSGEDYRTIWSRFCSELGGTISGTSRYVVRLDVALNSAVKEIEEAYESKAPIAGIQTGLTEFERKCGIFRRGDVFTIGAPTSKGKTAIATTIAKNVAAQGNSVIFLTTEMKARQLALRLLAAESGIENVRLQKGIIFDREFPVIVAAQGRVSVLRIYFIQDLRSWERAKSEIRRIKLMDQALALVVIDYAQLMEAKVTEQKRYLEVAKVSSDAKMLAGELDVGVLLLSQFNREGTKDATRKPRLSDLRESGSLEQDSDIVGLLSRDGDRAELDIAKNRSGRCDTVVLRFVEATTSFSDWTEPSAPRDFMEAAANG
jgi:replicative DNA helicase